MVRQIIVIACLAAIAGCGGSSPSASRPASTPTPAPAAGAATAPVLVQLIQQRPGALIDKITVRTDGSGLFDRPSGGVGRVQRNVVLDRSAVEKIRGELERAPARLPRGEGRRAPNGATYIVRFDGRTVVARQGREPAPLRRSIRLLAGMLVGDHVRKVIDEKLGGTAGSTHATGVGKERKAKEVVFFQRQGAAGATLDTLSVRADGTATHEMRYGGAGGRFREYVLRDGLLARIKRALTRLPGGSTITEGSPPPGGAQYLLRLQGRTLTGRAGGIAAPARPAIALLDGVIDGSGVASSKLVTQTHSR